VNVAYEALRALGLLCTLCATGTGFTVLPTLLTGGTTGEALLGAIFLARVGAVPHATLLLGGCNGLLGRHHFLDDHDVAFEAPHAFGLFGASNARL